MHVNRGALPDKRIPVKSAFTLMELLVVMAMVAVLASLLLPALSRAKASANSIKCRSNLRQLGLQLSMYVNDYGVYPSTRYVGTNLVGKGILFAADRAGTAWLLGPDEQGTKRCPTRVSDSEMDGVVPGSTSYGFNGFGYIGSKGLSSYQSLGLSGVANGPEAFYRPLNEAEVLVPSDMIALGDNLQLLPKTGSDLPLDTVMESRGGIGGSLARQETSGARGPGIIHAVKRAAMRHQNRGNIEFCDGHVESLTFRRLFLDHDDTSLRRWNKDHEPHR